MAPDASAPDHRRVSANPFNPATIAIAGVITAALVALLLAVLTRPGQAADTRVAALTILPHSKPTLHHIRPQHKPGTIPAAILPEPKPGTEPAAESTETDAPAAETTSVDEGSSPAPAPAPTNRPVPETEGTVFTPPATFDETAPKVFSVRSGDTLMRVLTRAGADRGQSHDAITALSDVFNPRRLQSGQKIAVSFTPADDTAPRRLASVTFNESVDRAVLVRLSDQGYIAEQVMREFETESIHAGGTIDLSLFDAAATAGIPAKTVIQLIRIFSFDVDFQREIQPGDTFEVFFDRYLDEDGTPVKEGPIQFASLTLSGQTLKYYRYQPGDSDYADYFDENGRSVKKSLMRTPIDGARLTSRYGKRRHPTLGYSKMHRGVDFGARTGTPIMAAGDGVIVKIGRWGAYGKYIRLRHNDTFSTAYAHMSRYAKSMRRGKRVKQGQIIGYVGTTGRSTGPHLHYEVLRGNRQVNPMKVRLPTGRKLKGKELETFLASIGDLKTRIATVPMTTKMASR
jgi:murein DD-endopeptidase MepM/ murein hydrolase activator NlpD